jgi:hypothetical protein
MERVLVSAVNIAKESQKRVNFVKEKSKIKADYKGDYKGKKAGLQETQEDDAGLAEEAVTTAEEELEVQDGFSKRLYAWRSIRNGDTIPPGAVLAGSTFLDGAVFVAQSKKECGKLNTRDGSISSTAWNVWTPKQGRLWKGKVLVVDETEGSVEWIKVRIGDLIPPHAICVAKRLGDPDNYACRDTDNEVGNLSACFDGRVYKIAFHSKVLARQETEILCVCAKANEEVGYPSPGLRKIRSSPLLTAPESSLQSPRFKASSPRSWPITGNQGYNMRRQPEGLVSLPPQLLTSSQPQARSLSPPDDEPSSSSSPGSPIRSQSGPVRSFQQVAEKPGRNSVKSTPATIAEGDEGISGRALRIRTRGFHESDPRIWVGTWNVASSDRNSPIPSERYVNWPGLTDVVPPDFDLYIMAIQEGSTENIFDGLSAYFDAKCNAERVSLDQDRVWGRGDGALLFPKYTGIAAWIARSTRPRVHKIRSCAVSAGTMRGSKGGTALALTLDGARLGFVGCHLSAETSEERAADCYTILAECGRKLSTAGSRSASRSSTPHGFLEQFDSVVFFGDLNYRLAEKGKEGTCVTTEKCQAMLADGNTQELWALDPLEGEVSRSTHPLHGFREPKPSPGFFPTYKKHPDRPALHARKDSKWVQGEFNIHFTEPWYKGGQTKLRMPSFTDRILVYTRQDALRMLSPCAERDAKGDPMSNQRYGYLCLPGHLNHDPRDLFGGSDHSPVAAEFQLSSHSS